MSAAPAFSYTASLHPLLSRAAVAQPSLLRAAFSVRATATPHSPVIR
jgi:hypothetical protein